MSASERLLPTLAALAVMLGAAFAVASHLTLGFRAFTAEDARRIRIAAASMGIVVTNISRIPGPPMETSVAETSSDFKTSVVLNSGSSSVPGWASASAVAALPESENVT